MMVRADDFRKKVSDMLTGKGLELGPGQIVFPAPRAESVLLVDKLPVDLHKSLFPELGADVHIVEPDILIDFDLNRLEQLPDLTFNFVIASHLLEHVAQPFRMLDEIYDKLVPGGLLVLFLPDRRRTFDKGRVCPPKEHFIEEYIMDNRVVRDDDLREYLEKVERYEWNGIMNSFVERHLERSIHVHAWTDQEFISLLNAIQPISKFAFDIVGGVSSSNNPEFEEFGVLLSKKVIGHQVNFISSWKKILDQELRSNVILNKRTNSKFLQKLRNFLRYIFPG